MFDKAARGPLGALQLILRRHKHTVLGGAAAWVVLAALLVDPFTQLVLSFPSRKVVSSSLHAQTASAMSYESGATFSDGLGVSDQ